MALFNFGENAGGIGNLALNAYNTFWGSKKASARAARDQYNYNLALQKQQQEYNTEMFQNRYQMTVKDLQKAGINPLYAVGGHTPTVSSGLNSIGMPEYVAEQNGRLQNLMAGLQLAQDFSVKRATAKKLEAETNTENINTGLKALEKINQQIQNELGKKHLKWYDETKVNELNKLKSEIVENLSSSENLQAQAGNARQMTHNAKETIQNTERRNKFFKELENEPGGGKDYVGAEIAKDLYGTGIVGNVLTTLYGAGSGVAHEIRRMNKKVRGKIKQLNMRNRR